MHSTDKNSRQNHAADKDGSLGNTENTSEALQQAEKDISNDPDLTPEPDPAADLDEGELARLEGEE